jgi:hypothetical protein
MSGLRTKCVSTAALAAACMPIVAGVVADVGSITANTAHRAHINVVTHARTHAYAL